MINNLGGATPLRNFGLVNMLKTTYPDYSWDEKLLSRRNKKACQFILKRKVESLFPGFHVKEDYRHPDIRYESTSKIGELDLFLPDINLAFEYNGEQHYHDYPAFAPVELYVQRDAEKLKLCKLNGIDLVVVPYWWDETEASLINFIEAVNPTLVKNNSKYQ